MSSFSPKADGLTKAGMPVPDDKDLILRFQRGEDSAFNDLVHKYQKPLYVTIYRLLGTHEEAEDVSQEVFLKIYRGLRDFRGDSNFFTWIYRIAVNLSLNVIRKKKLRQILSLEAVGLTIRSSAPGPDQQVEKKELRQHLEKAIQRLPNKQKIVFTLRYFQQLPHAEIARILNRDVGTIKANYHQAIKKLQKAVQK